MPDIVVYVAWFHPAFWTQGVWGWPRVHIFHSWHIPSNFYKGHFLIRQQELEVVQQRDDRNEEDTDSTVWTDRHWNNYVDYKCFSILCKTCVLYQFITILSVFLNFTRNIPICTLMWWQVWNFMICRSKFNRFCIAINILKGFFYLTFWCRAYKIWTYFD